MINKRSSINYNYHGLKALHERLNNGHPLKGFVHSKFMSVKAGIKGEEVVEGIFNKYTFPFNYKVLFNLNLSSDGKFQIDALFISQHYLLILESKNIIGELSFERNPFCLKRKLENGQLDIFESPEIQLERNIKMLERWLEKRAIQIPIVGAIVLSTTKSEIVKPPISHAIMYPSNIPNFIWEQPRDSVFMTADQLEELRVNFLRNHDDYYPYPMCRTWGIDFNDLIKGVRCTECDWMGMKRIIRNWQCPNCLHQNKEAHVRAIRDWFILVGEEMTNNDCRNFLQLEMSQTANRLLHGMELKSVGFGKSTKYKMERGMLDKILQ